MVLLIGRSHQVPLPGCGSQPTGSQRIAPSAPYVASRVSGATAHIQAIRQSLNAPGQCRRHVTASQHAETKPADPFHAAPADMADRHCPPRAEERRWQANLTVGSLFIGVAARSTKEHLAGSAHT